MKVPQIGTCLAILAGLFFAPISSAQTLRPSANGHHLEWSNGTPVFLLSDTCWMLGPSYTQAEVVSHANTRKAQGFVALQLAAVMPSLHPLTQAFTNGDFNRPVASYWTALDAKVKAITDAGLVVIINPFWLKSGADFTSEFALNANSDAKCLAYGRFFGTRYRNNPRVVYFLGGDARPNRGVDNTSRLDNLGLGIQQVYAEAGLPKAIIAYHSAPGVPSRQSWPNASWLTLDWTYSYSEPLGPDGDANYFTNWAEWARTPAMPIMHAEGWYDRDNGATTTSRFGDRHIVRRQGWWVVLAGSLGGCAYGAEPIWLHGYKGITPATAVNWNSGKDAARMKTILSQQQWWRLRPDTTASFISGSVGAGLTRAIGATADDGSFGIAYTPVAATFNLRMPGSGRTFTLAWHDPASGAIRTLRTATSGTTVSVTTPGTNSSGQQDWVVIASSGATPPPPPPPPPPGTIQGESAVIAGGVVLETKNAGFTGASYLNFPPTGGSAQFNGINGGTGGAKTITIRFSNGASNGLARTGRLLVNGMAQAITFGSTGTWTTWSNLNVTVNFNANTSNTLRFESTGEDLGNIDQITIP